MEITLLILIAAISGFTEAFKRNLRKLFPLDAEGKSILSDDLFGLIVFIVSLITGIASLFLYPGVFADPVLAATPFNHPSLVNILVVGVALGIGSKGLYFVLELTSSLKSVARDYSNLKKVEAETFQNQTVKALARMVQESRASSD